MYKGNSGEQNSDIRRLITDLESNDQSLSMQAESTLYDTSQEAIPFLINVIQNSQSIRARRVSVWIIYKISPRISDSRLREQAVSALIEALKDNDEIVRKNAPWGLSVLGGNQAISSLRTAVNDPSGDVRSAVEFALQRLGG